MQQVVFPVGTWIIDMKGVDLSIDNYGNNKDTKPRPLKPSVNDRNCAASLRDELRSILPHLDRLPDAGIAHHMVLIARRLSELNSGFSKTKDPDATSMAPVIAVIAQHLLTIASWNMSASPDPEATVDSFPVRWQVYGSGPRLAWEWAAVVILVVVLLAVLLGGIFGLASGVEPGPWLEPAGIMLIANQSDSMDSVKGSVGGAISQRAAESKYYLRESVKDGASSLVLVDDSHASQDTKEINKTTTYTNEGHIIIVTRKFNWKFWTPYLLPAGGMLSKVSKSWKRPVRP